ncbi:DUF5682 family protein [Nocardia macrotermitis]|uniref:Uncharacterized protein n=1 Tax=Nocardia macrotermitis TaxID=2585198 RepID=A0A7K0D2L5_9NOCA|nr:DUF5682 family protein [Nocardia macrotermitis]MQY19966.1 hypothetical protein [Nocardia macrotermitis]
MSPHTTDSPPDSAAAVASQTRVFGIRHHGPGSARSLRLALERFRPDVILIEGPADADPLLTHIAAEGMAPPVALLAYVPDTPAQAAFWPFAVFSPEWQALSYAHEHDVTVGFCDLPATHTLAARDEPADRTDPLALLATTAGYDDPERWWDAIIESTADADIFDAVTEAMAVLRETPTAAAATATTRVDPDAAAATGSPADETTVGSQGNATSGFIAAQNDSDSAITDRPLGNSTAVESTAPRSSSPDDATIESAGTADGIPEYDAAQGDCRAAGFAPDKAGMPQGPADDAEELLGSPVDPHTLQREAYMRQTMRKALKGGARRLAVVCGAFHAPALVGKLGPATADAQLLKGLPKVKATLTWVPWTHSRLAGASGYGAGVTSPGWYHHLFTETEQPIARWLTRVAGTLRAHDLPVSSAHIIESVRLANTLAALRERPLPGLSEVTEATRAVLCEGDETMLRLVTRALVVGEALGAVPEDTPAVPLETDLRAQARTLRLTRQALSRQLDLDLRKDRDVARSRLLHQLRLLGIGWGTPTSSEVRNTGTFRETWTLVWEPELAIAVIEASRWGTTLLAAAEAKILDSAAAPEATIADLSRALEQALLADLGGAIPGLVARLESAAAVDHDVTRLLGALPGLIRTLRYGDVRGTDVTALTRVADGMLVRICAGLPGAVTGLDADAAAALRALIDDAHLALATRDDEWATREWHTALGKLADRADVHGSLVGRAVRLLCDAGILDDAESARRLSAALSVGHDPTEKAAWIDGFLGGRGLFLVHDRNLLHRIDTWLRGLDEDQFTATLPLLRRTFGAFESGERQAIAQAVRDGGPATTTPTGTDDFDLDRGLLALHAATRILAVT